ncbi:hypothetical protein E3N88_04398 [Mikania micrantha]|uniref:Uncharacterized protein n=1 Tax=Mikania micrantha TaxID=192012 RepID=A0A5N6PX56_9ASTR|nr:hypothetical protein E3N88_04398 [Mikania micrantha]
MIRIGIRSVGRVAILERGFSEYKHASIECRHLGEEEEKRDVAAIDDDEDSIVEALKLLRSHWSKKEAWKACSLHHHHLPLLELTIPGVLKD